MFSLLEASRSGVGSGQTCMSPLAYQECPASPGHAAKCQRLCLCASHLVYTDTLASHSNHCQMLHSPTGTHFWEGLSARTALIHILPWSWALGLAEGTSDGNRFYLSGSVQCRCPTTPSPLNCRLFKHLKDRWLPGGGGPRF